MVTQSDEAVVPLCAGRWELFDSINVADHRIAAQFCAVCPMRDACRETMLAAQREKPLPGAKYGPCGTWAGLLLNPKNGGVA